MLTRSDGSSRSPRSSWSQAARVREGGFGVPRQPADAPVEGPDRGPRHRPGGANGCLTLDRAVASFGGSSGPRTGGRPGATRLDGRAVADGDVLTGTVRASADALPDWSTRTATSAPSAASARPGGRGGRPRRRRPRRDRRRRLSSGLALEPELLEPPGARAAGVVADQLPALRAQPVEHRAGVPCLALRRSAGQLDAHSGALRLRVVGGDDRCVFPCGHVRRRYPVPLRRPSAARAACRLARQVLGDLLVPRVVRVVRVGPDRRVGRVDPVLGRGSTNVRPCRARPRPATTSLTRRWYCTGIPGA